MRLLSLSLALVFAASSAHATHIVGGELYYDHLGGDQYQVSLKLYRDCGPGNVNQTGYDASAMLGVFGGDGSTVSIQNMAFPGAIELPIALDNPCLTAPPDVCIELAIYTMVLTLPARPDGYVLTYQRCCRTPTIINLQDAGDQGLTCTVRIPGTVVENSSARFIAYPPVVLCLNEPLLFDHSASDADGDSLVYALRTPLNGGSSINPTPTPVAPPYAPILWQGGYSGDYPMDSSPIMSIHPSTGLLTVTPTLAASYTVAVEVKEYRNGTLLSETIRDFRFDVVPCQAQVNAQIAPQAEFCQGLTLAFNNTSPSGQLWSWEFGEGPTAQDTSSLHSPQWTYTSPGTYTVTLIANPGLVCADTTQSLVDVRVLPEASFTPPPAVCGSGGTTLVAEGRFGPGATFSWQLSGAVPSTASGPSVDVMFPAPGVHGVTLTVVDEGCSNTYTDLVTTRALPEAYFTLSPASPQAYGVDVALQDGSSANGGEIVAWNWYANGAPIGSGPASAWLHPVPGTYDVQLLVTTADGCTATYSLPYEIIEVPIHIPNVFTPNGDASNERFSILNIEQHQNDLTIFNRWGTPVYAVQNYRNQWAAPGVPDGTYYYELVLADGRTYTGHLTLLR
ncbi:MAG: gliding motility-associated C-terminal domain-containing protein [Flavobacteriales bacterium]|nr:gliding motility-associated C-terminal domain-containing protein [Flavobacteriales bacterium]